MAAKEETQMEDNGKLLVPLEWYLKAGIHIGTKYKNKSVSNFIYKAKPNGLKILDIEKIDQRLRMAAKLLARYEPEKILVVCRRETGIKAVKKMSEITGMRNITGRYLPGLITNPEYHAYIEPEIMLVCDPWHDKQAIKDALISNIPVVALVGSNNSVENIDFAVPCNNKSKKSLPLIFYILGREYLKERGIIKDDKEYNVSLQDFTDENL